MKRQKFNGFSLVMLFLLILYCVFLVTLIGWGLMKSFQGVEDYIWSGLSAISFPKTISLDNYKFAFTSLKAQIPYAYGGYYVYFPEMFLYSIIFAVSSSFTGAFTACVIGYCLAKFNNRFNKVIETLYYIGMLFPIIGAMGSTIQVTKQLHLYNSWLIVIAFNANFLGTDLLIFKSIFRTLTGGYAEAAKIDGANEFVIFFKVLLPLTRTIFSIYFITGFLGAWNGYQTPMIYLPSYPTVSYGLFKYASANSSETDYITYKVAGFITVLIPSFIIFFSTKKYMLGSDLSLGGIKG